MPRPAHCHPWARLSDPDQIRAWKVSGDGGLLASRQALVPTGRVYPYTFLLVRGAPRGLTRGAA
ncbi:hypothetical protein BH23GEM9_BH23GEM9_23530 [soil metagenome]